MRNQQKDYVDSLDEVEQTLEFWETKQRELLTSVVDYNLGTLVDLISSGHIDVAPNYQRRYRWDDNRQSKLIESFLMNVPVPPIFLNEDSYGKYAVIDGKQRLNAISRFLGGQLELSGLKVFADINQHSFTQLPDKLQAVLKTRPTLRAVIILRQSDEDIKFEVFQRLNSGGVSLNAQEIRNSTFPGPFNDQLLRVSEHNKLFHRLLGIKNKRTSPMFQEMKDVEFALRFLTFQGSWKSFTGGMKWHMDRFMAEHQRISAEEAGCLVDNLLQTLSAVEGAFGSYAFRRWNPEKGSWRRPVLASLYDAEMFACMGRSPERLRERQDACLSGLKRLFTLSEFRKAVDAATNTPSYFRYRIEAVSSMLDDEVGTSSGQKEG